MWFVLVRTQFFLAIEDISSIPKNDSAFSVLLHLSMLREHVFRLKKSFPVAHYSLPMATNPSWNIVFGEALDEHEIDEVYLYDSSSIIPINEILHTCAARNIDVSIKPSPNFVLSSSFPSEISHKANEEDFLDFYYALRKQMRILVDPQGEVIEKEWKIDPHAIKPLSKERLPVFELSATSGTICGQLSLVYPELSANFLEFNQATVREEALVLLDCFLKHHLHEVPIAKNIDHAQQILKDLPIIPYLNSGLILPLEVIHKALSVGARFDIKFAHVENLVRLILGWREYIQLRKVQSLKNGSMPQHRRAV
jgi:deoxyribodipyrimidine photolyase-like uncharacterized protein